MSHKCVVRNSAYRKGEFNLRERHNERKNEQYGNGDIDVSRSHMNVHFKQCNTTYEQAFNKLVEENVVSLRGLQADAKVFDELVFDVNSNYFEEHGGYDYAKRFFEEAYQLAIKEAGGEEFILSAVMHADERNVALSEELGKDVFHYHLHVVYLPVVDKEIKWSKRTKDKSLIGKTKEIVKQISHSKKWSKFKQYDEQGEVIRNENGKAILINSYSLLQDRFFEHMQNAGFTDFERGARNSTAKHLSDLEYKIKKDMERSDDLNKELGEKSEEVQKLDTLIEKNQKTLTTMKKNYNISKQVGVTFSELENMAKINRKGNYELPHKDWSTLLNLAKKGVLSKNDIETLTQQNQSARKDIEIYRGRLLTLQKETTKYNQAKKLNPEKTDKFLDKIIAEGKEKVSLHEPQKKKDFER